MQRILIKVARRPWEIEPTTTRLRALLRPDRSVRCRESLISVDNARAQNDWFSHHEFHVAPLINFFIKDRPNTATSCANPQWVACMPCATNLQPYPAVHFIVSPNVRGPNPLRACGDAFEFRFPQPAPVHSVFNRSRPGRVVKARRTPPRVVCVAALPAFIRYHFVTERCNERRCMSGVPCVYSNDFREFMKGQCSGHLPISNVILQIFTIGINRTNVVTWNVSCPVWKKKKRNVSGAYESLSLVEL